MNLIKRNNKDSVHIFGIQPVPDALDRELGITEETTEVDAVIISHITSNVEVRIQLDGMVRVFFMDYADFPIVHEYQIYDWFVDNKMEWSDCDKWIENTGLHFDIVKPSFASRLAGALEICRLLLDLNFHDAWNFTVATELKGGNEYDYMPLHEYIHPAYIRGI